MVIKQQTSGQQEVSCCTSGQLTYFQFNRLGRGLGDIGEGEVQEKFSRNFKNNFFLNIWTPPRQNLSHCPCIRLFKNRSPKFLLSKNDSIDDTVPREITHNMHLHWQSFEGCYIVFA